METSGDQAVSQWRGEGEMLAVLGLTQDWPDNIATPHHSTPLHTAPSSLASFPRPNTRNNSQWAKSPDYGHPESEIITKIVIL